MDAEEIPELHIKLTNKGMLLYDGWSKEKLLGLLRDKLMRQYKIKLLLPIYPCNDVQCDASLESCHSIIHSGIYNERILVELERKGMSPHKIMKVFKYGLLSLNSEELEYFQDFGADMNVVNNKDMWSRKLDVKLIWNLIVAGLTENQCWNIVTCGLVSQDERVLCRLLWSGVDVPGILNWPGQIKPVTATIITFLKKLDIDEDILLYVKEHGIDDEVEDMLIDLGYNEYSEERQTLEEILCSLTILESTASSSLTTSHSAGSNKAVPMSVSTQSAPCACTCCLNLLPNKQGHEALKRNDYLR
ncbi:PREDICTED: uncharacterized protein LOC106746798 [Dinoponera quadriceps]|uniref:Uncharacterized protein LOC106746798 n=1 Tax=Dinoponera quadriceps TaxID=609295 RepID=A0A6P3XLH1_DINQU|nr:PREDICTED: uncharacterized protein LOC106746798 [Dinoponera quadriceps]